MSVLHHHDHEQHIHHTCCSSSCNGKDVSDSTDFSHEEYDKNALFYIEAMDCAVEQSQIQQLLSKIINEEKLSFDLSKRILAIDGNFECVELCLKALEKAGFKPIKVDHLSGEEVTNSKNQYIKATIALFLALSCEILSFLSSENFMPYILMIISLISIGLCGFSTYRSGILSLTKFRLNINALMSLAVTGAFFIGEFSEAAMVMVLYEIAEMIEHRVALKAKNSAKKLLMLKTDYAEVCDQDGVWREQSVDQIKKGMFVRSHPGQRIALDGIVKEGSGSVDQSFVTGESMPVEKNSGDILYAGTINQNGLLTYCVTADSGQTVLDKIIAMVEKAQSHRAPMQRFVDRFAAVYTPSVFILALLIALILPLLEILSWQQALYKALVMLVISCPCALVLSTPATIVSALASAAKKGILVKGGQFLEMAAKLSVIAMDKTGTVTFGQPKLIQTVFSKSEFNNEDVLKWAYSMVKTSDHPVSIAIKNGLPEAEVVVEQMKEISGKGLKAKVDGRDMLLGNARLLEQFHITNTLSQQAANYEALGHSVSFVSDTHNVLALFAVSDSLRPSAVLAMKELHDKGLVTAMLTGDNSLVAKSIGKRLSIKHIYSQLLPEQKQLIIEELKQRYGMTAMIGDGINDAPSLSSAHIGISMGAGATDIAIESADIVLMNNDLMSLPQLIDLSKKTRQVLWENIWISIGVKLIFMGLAVAGFAAMWMAVIADTGVCLIVVANGLKMLKK